MNKLLAAKLTLAHASAAISITLTARLWRMDRSTIVTAGIALVLLVVIAANSYLRWRHRNCRICNDPESLAVRFQRGETPGHDDITTNKQLGVVEEGKFTDKLR